VPGIIIGTGSFCKEKPTKTENDFFVTWKDSAELQQKRVLFDILKYSFDKRHKVKDGQTKAKNIVGFVRKALTAFADGNEAAGNKELGIALGECQCIKSIFEFPLIQKGLVRERMDVSLKSVQPEGTKANQETAKKRKGNLLKAVKDYCKNKPKNKPGSKPPTVDDEIDDAFNFLEKRKLTYGYKKSTFAKYARPFLKQTKNKR
jgi:hypothetical protein